MITYFQYVRSEESTSIDEENGIVTISTVGRCVPSDEDVGFWVFAGPIIGFHVVLLVGTNVLLYNVREVGDRYQEQKYVAMASALMCEVFVVGIPVLVSIRDSPNAMYIVLTAIIALDDIGKLKSATISKQVHFGSSFVDLKSYLFCFLIRHPLLHLFAKS